MHFLGRLSAQPPFACRFPARYLGKGTLTPVFFTSKRKSGVRSCFAIFADVASAHALSLTGHAGSIRANRLRRFEEVRLFQDLIHMTICAAVALFILMEAPTYSEPASGCYERGLSTLVMGCSSWPNFVYGILFVSLFGVMGPKRTRAHIWGMTLLLVVAAFGGPDAIRQGSLIETFDGSGFGLIGWRGPGFALALGGGSACVFFQIIGRKKGSESAFQRARD